MRLPDTQVGLQQVVNQLGPRNVFEGLVGAFGDAALCVRDEAFRARIRLLADERQLRAMGMNWYVEGWERRIHLVSQAGRLATVDADDGRYAITTATHWARTNRDKARLVQRHGRTDGEYYVIQEVPGLSPDHFPVREFRSTRAVTQPELGLLTASQIIGHRVLSAEAGLSLFEHELRAIDDEVLGYRDAGYAGEKLYRDEAMPGMVTAELLSTFAGPA